MYLVVVDRMQNPANPDKLLILMTYKVGICSSRILAVKLVVTIAVPEAGR